ncbi:MAG TPA: hypothetical protein DD473_07745 [Planctomycetaceae bacterium]|nr:hypothetical protein [Planctomycetaceae bacterium]
MQSCPTPNKLLELVSGDQSGELGRHVDNCPGCKRELEKQLSDLREQSTLVEPLNSVTSSWGTGLAHRLAASLKDSPGEELVVDFELPYQMGNYTLLRILGAGGMGIVYLANQESLNRRVAIKMVRQSELKNKKLVSRFYTEVESVASLNHSGIVPIYEVGRHKHYLYYSMQLVEEGTLSEFIRRDKPPIRVTAKIVQQIAEAVHFAHQNGIIHRDLKPSNILVDSSSNPKIADFGLAKLLSLDPSLSTGSYDIVGTPSYMSPEQVSGKESHTFATDVYGLGAILYEMLTGRAPFVGKEPLSVLHDVLEKIPESPRVIDKSIPQDLETITLKCLQKHPAHRYPTAECVADELDSYLRGKMIQARPTPLPEKLGRLVRRNPFTSILILMTALIVGVSVVNSFNSLRLSDLQAKKIESQNIKLESAVLGAQNQSSLVASQAELSIEVIEAILGEIQTTYLRLPAEQKSRKVMLNQVLNKLDRLSADHVDPDQLNSCYAKTILGLAEVEYSIGASDGSIGLEASKRRYIDAIERLQKLYQNNMDNLDVQRTLARAIMKYGDVLADAAHWEEAHAKFMEALPLMIEACSKSSEDMVLMELGELEILCAEGFMHTGYPDQFEEFSNRGHRRLKEITETSPGSLEAASLFLYSCQIIGDWHLKKNHFDDAKQYYEMFQQKAVLLDHLYPFNSNVALDCSTAYERLGDLALKSKDIDLALDHYQLSLDYAQKLEISAPDNLETLWHVSFSYQHLADLLLHLKELEQGFPLAVRCVEIRRILQDRDRQNYRRTAKLVHSLKTLAAYHLSQSENILARNIYQECFSVETEYQLLTGKKSFANDLSNLESKIAVLD